jgi:NAD(P)-dependent dehydrogenase (short-subunit alcohol dehydrogenase family)
MDLNLEGRTVLISGGSRGIGRATALAYARENANVAITYHTGKAAAAAVLDEIRAAGAQAAAAFADLADPASIRAAADTVRERFGGIDVLVANAVRWPTDVMMPLADAGLQPWTAAVRANFEGTTALIQAALPDLERSGTGRIVLISSGVARDGRSGATAYASAKAALDGLVAALKWEAGQHGILVNIVSPGFTVTENNLARFPDELRESVRQRTPSARLSTPSDVARAVLFLGSPANGNITGTYLPVAGGIS